MCLILFALNNHPKYKMILAANRDEFHSRPTLKAGFWEEQNDILSGIDDLSKGTWLGISKQGRFIAITNYRSPNSEIKAPKSRGNISRNFLLGKSSVHTFVTNLQAERHRYSGFNILLSDNKLNSMYHYSNISNQLTMVPNGYHGLSNHLLDTDWPKVTYGKRALRSSIISGPIHPKKLIEMLKNETFADDKELPDTGISFELEKKLSPVFISMKDYGTRCSTVLLVDNHNMLSFVEVSYNENREVISEQSFNFELKS